MAPGWQPPWRYPNRTRFCIYTNWLGQSKWTDHVIHWEVLVLRQMVGHFLTDVTRRITLSQVIKTFADKPTKDLYENGKSKRFPPDMWERALRKLEYLDLATSLFDLKVPPSNRLHKFERNRAGQYSISGLLSF